MHVACANGHLEVAEWLFGAGAAEDVRTANIDGCTPMFGACANGHLVVAERRFGAAPAEYVRTAGKHGFSTSMLACLLDLFPVFTQRSPLPSYPDQ